MNHDVQFMRAALDLAERGAGGVEPNPLVGAILVKNGKIVARGHHRRFGGPHAEVVAIRSAGNKARGTTLYVNLEPCCHYGKTPPCVDLIIQSGVRRVVTAMKDPNPLMNGKGLGRLRKAGVDVTVGVLRAEAEALNAPFIKHITRRLPYVYAKWAMTLDGKIAAATGDSRWVSSPASLAFARAFRSTVQAVVVGINTILRDDSLLLPSGANGRPPLRVVLDSAARTPLSSRLVKSTRHGPVMVAVGSKAMRSRVDRLYRRGCIILMLPRVTVGAVLRAIAEQGCQKVLIEGGGEVHASALREGVVDEVMVFVAPKIIGGRRAITPVEGPGIPIMGDALRIDDVRVERIGDDLLIRGKIHR